MNVQEINIFVHTSCSVKCNPYNHHQAKTILISKNIFEKYSSNKSEKCTLDNERNPSYKILVSSAGVGLCLYDYQAQTEGMPSSLQPVLTTHNATHASKPLIQSQPKDKFKFRELFKFFTSSPKGMDKCEILKQNWVFCQQFL